MLWLIVNNVVLDFCNELELIVHFYNLLSFLVPFKSFANITIHLE